MTEAEIAAFVDEFARGAYHARDADAPPVRFSDRRRPGFRQGFEDASAYPRAAAMDHLRLRGFVLGDVIAERRRAAVIEDCARRARDPLDLDNRP